MDWTWYLFRFNGRICRAEFWGSLLYLFCGMMLLLVLCAGVMVLSSDKGSFSVDAHDVFKIVDPATYRWSLLDNLPLVLLKLAATALVLWVYLAITVKRLHDRDKSAWWLLAFFVLPGLYKQFEDRLPESTWMLPIALASVVLYFSGLRETCFLRGTQGPNRFGPDPLAGAEDASASASHPGRGWDQQSAIEIVPPSASPPAACMLSGAHDRCSFHCP